MSITKADILSRVNQITGRSETDIDDQIYDALLEISERTRALKTSTTGSTTANQAYISKPSDMAGDIIDGLILDTTRYDPITWDEWLDNQGYNTGVWPNQASGISGWVVRGDYIYVRPTPDTVKSYTLYYAKYHPSSLDTILFEDKFRRAIIHLTAAFVYEKYEIDDQQEKEMVLYEREINRLSVSSPPSVVQPRSFRS
ncbi:MAG TPA: hypothetical protein HPP87_10550 [Planctomycetes bacterium]|nr:hypothetical protein [Planctomycetota bacterium]